MLVMPWVDLDHRCVVVLSWVAPWLVMVVWLQLPRLMVCNFDLAVLDLDTTRWASSHDHRLQVLLNRSEQKTGLIPNT